MDADRRGATLDRGRRERRNLYSIAALLWLLPFLGARTSETISAAALCFGIALLEWRAERRSRSSGFGLAVLAGLALGLCFEFRYPSGAMAAGAALWYLRPAEKRAALFSGLMLGGILALTLGVLVDWWGYGTATFPAYSYLHQNFVMGRAAGYGTAPFFAYLYLPLVTPWPLLALFLLLATLVTWLSNPRSVLTWATLPYVTLLSIASHKEQRFLLPLTPFLPFFVVFALASKPPVAAWLASAVRWLASGRRLQLGYLLNICSLLGVLLVPVPGVFQIYQLIENESVAAERPVDAAVVHAPGRLPYWDSGLRLVFLEPKNIRWTLNPSVAEL